jgi:hypothetical protein
MKHIEVINLSQTTKLFIKKWQLEEEAEEGREEAEEEEVPQIKY